VSKSSDRAELYLKALDQLIAKDDRIRLHAEPGREFLFRPGQLLVTAEDLQRVIAKLRENGFRFEMGKGFLGLERVILPDNPDDIPRIVRLLRDPRTWPGERIPLVQPHHLTVGHGGNMHGCPGDRPRPTGPLPKPGKPDLGKGVTIGVIDTGISATAATDHPDWLGGWYTPQADDVDAAYDHGDFFALQGGHGTFVAGVARQAAPGVRFDPEAALAPNGLGDEEALATAITGLDRGVQIVNMSLGCFTLDNVASEPVRRAIKLLPKDVVVVASAGNQGTERPSWPGALPNVVGVAALALNGDGTLVPACYSNHGHWVDLCAVGNRSSTYLKGEWQLPGEPAPEAFDRFAYWAGTSFATPHVSGTIAALMTTNGISAGQARDLLLSGPEFHPGYGVRVP
jgi:subtilisin family serine protease